MTISPYFLITVVSTYLLLSIISSMKTKFPGALEFIHSHTMTEPCFTVPLVFLRLNFSFGLSHTLNHPI